MDNNELIRQANNIVSDYINRNKNKKNTALLKNTVKKNIIAATIMLALFMFIMSIINFMLWHTA